VYLKKIGCVLSSCGSEQGPVLAVLKTDMQIRIRHNIREGGLTDRVHRACISIFDRTRSGLYLKVVKRFVSCTLISLTLNLYLCSINMSFRSYLQWRKIHFTQGNTIKY